MQSVIGSMKWSIALAVFGVVSASKVDAANIVVPPVVVQTLSHSFSNATSFPFENPSIVRESFSIGSGYTGGGAFSVPSIANGDTVLIRVEAAAGKKFQVIDPGTRLSFSLNWQTNSGDSISTSGGTVTFENLVGNVPNNTYSFLGVGNGGNAISTQLQYSELGLIEFTAINIAIPVQPSPPAGPRNFNAVSSSSTPAFTFVLLGGSDHSLVQLATVPEPGTLVALSGASLLMRRRRVV